MNKRRKKKLKVSATTIHRSTAAQIHDEFRDESMIRLSAHDAPFKNFET
jgi:hypothetical protein